MTFGVAAWVWTPPLIEDEKIISQDIKIAKAFNGYFISLPITNMTANQVYECLDSEKDNPVLKIIKKFQNLSNITVIKAKNTYKFQTFRFRETNTDEIRKSTQNLDLKKAF